MGASDDGVDSRGVDRAGDAAERHLQQCNAAKDGAELPGHFVTGECAGQLLKPPALTSGQNDRPAILGLRVVRKETPREPSSYPGSVYLFRITMSLIRNYLLLI